LPVRKNDPVVRIRILDAMLGEIITSPTTAAARRTKRGNTQVRSWRTSLFLRELSNVVSQRHAFPQSILMRESVRIERVHLTNR